MPATEARIKGSPSKALLWTTVGFWAGFLGVSLYSPLVPRFTESMSLSPLLGALLLAIPLLGGSLLRIPFGAMVDKTGGKKPFLILLGTSIVGLVGLVTLLYFIPRPSFEFYPLVLLLGILGGAGVATFPVGISQTAYWFPMKKQGRALAAYAGLGNTAAGFFAGVLPPLFIMVGILGAYGIWLVILVVLTIGYGLFIHDAPSFQLRKQGITPDRKTLASFGQELIPSGSIQRALKIAALKRPTWGLVVLYFTSFGGFLALTAWFPIYWFSFHQTTLVFAGLSTIMFSVTSSVVRVPGGYLSDRIGGERTLLIFALVLLVGAIGMIFGDSIAMALVSEITLAIGMGFMNAAVFKLVPKYVPESVGGASGLVGGLGAFGGFTIPLILGASVSALGASGYGIGFVVFIVLALISLVVTWTLIRSKTTK